MTRDGSTPDGYLFLTGRLKEIINQGGEKIAPSEIDEVLTRHCAVAQAVTFAVPHATLGEAVAAAIVLKRGAQATESELQDFAAARLAEFKTPKQILFVDEIPKGPTGKLQRIGLADKFADLLAPKREANFVSAETSVEKEVAEIWRRLSEGRAGRIARRFQRVGGRFAFDDDHDPTSRGALQSNSPDRQFSQVAHGTKPGPAHSAGRSHACARLEQINPVPSRPITDSLLGGLRNRILQCVALYIPGNKTSRVWLHRMRGVAIGRNVSIGLSALIESAYPRLVSIGNNVTIGMRAVIIGHLRDSTAQARMLDRPTVRLEDNVYLGPGVIVLPNVTIGHGAVVSAGSVVTHSVPPKTLVQGNPAKPVAHCGVSLGGGVPYEQFLRQLTPIKD